jgi:hypothetical protein
MDGQHENKWRVHEDKWRVRLMRGQGRGVTGDTVE